jgi:uncharacterized protein (TIGR03083 family)
MTEWTPGPALAAYHSGVVIICELSARFTAEAWQGPTPCPEWRAVDLAGHLRCVADNYHEYLDDAPTSLLSRLMAGSAGPPSLARKLARQNAAELAALPDATGPQHIAAFAASARGYAQRVLDVWDMPHHSYRDTLVTVGGFVGAACAEWHLHAWDLARSLGKDYRPAACEVLVAGWQAGMPHLPLEVRVPVGTCASAARSPSPKGAEPGDPGPADPDGWRALLRVSGRV